MSKVKELSFYVTTALHEKIEFLDLWQASVIKGNAGELAALAGSNEVYHVLE